MKRVEFLNHAIEELAHFDNPTMEAEWLLAEILGISRSKVRENAEIDPKEQAGLEKALKKRKKGVPLDYITGKNHFYGLNFYVSRHVLVPRPETEELVEQVLKEVTRTSRVLDIGTGSGVIAITIAKLSGASVLAVDRSLAALKVAKKNALLNKTSVCFKRSNLFKNVSGKFDLIVSNPPYISASEYAELDEWVRRYEPKVALKAGKRGDEFYQEIIAKAPSYLSKNGKIFFEIGSGQAASVAKMLEKDFCEICVKKDLEGRDRIISARVKGE